MVKKECPSCGLKTVIESVFLEDGEEEPCLRCTHCGWWGDKKDE